MGTTQPVIPGDSRAKCCCTRICHPPLPPPSPAALKQPQLSVGAASLLILLGGLKQAKDTAASVRAQA